MRKIAACAVAGGMLQSGPGAQPEPSEVAAPVAMPPQGPAPGHGAGPGPAAPGAVNAPGTEAGPANAPPVAPGMPPGAPPPPPIPLGPGEGAATPQSGAPGVGGVRGPGAAPGPGGTPGAYVPPGPEQYWYLAAGNPDRGKDLIRRYGCGTCHKIQGLREARGMVGPPLTGGASRADIAVLLQNSLQSRARWIENPPGFLPNVVMPNMGVSRAEANDISAYWRRCTESGVGDWDFGSWVQCSKHPTANPQPRIPSRLRTAIWEEREHAYTRRSPARDRSGRAEGT